MREVVTWGCDLKLRGTLCVLLLANSLSAQASDTNNDGFVTILIPVFMNEATRIEGAFGSVWTGQTFLHNATGAAIVTFQYGGGCAGSCQPAYPTGYLGQFFVDSNLRTGGALAWVTAEKENYVHLAVRLLEVTRRAQPTGVNLPIVREGEFLTEPTTLLGIAAGPEIRSTLRVYDPRAARNGRVLVQILDDEANVIATRELTLDYPGYEENPAHPWKPGSTSITDLTTSFPELTGLTLFHVRIIPLTAGMEYWAFVSITDNESQHVLLVTP